MKIERWKLSVFSMLIFVSLFCVSCAKTNVPKEIISTQDSILFNSESEYANYMNKEFSDSKDVYNYDEKKKYFAIVDNVGSVSIKYFLGFNQEKNMNLEGISLVNLSGEIKVGFIRYNKSSSSIIGKFEVRVNKNQENNADVLKQLEKEHYQEKNDCYVKIINVDIPLDESITTTINRGQ